MRQTLVVIVDGHGEHALGAELADDVVVQHLADFCRGGHALGGLDHGGLVLFADDVHAQFDAFIADEYGRTGDQLTHFVLRLAAERAVKRVLGGFAVRRLTLLISLSFQHAGHLWQGETDYSTRSAHFPRSSRKMTALSGVRTGFKQHV